MLRVTLYLQSISLSGSGHMGRTVMKAVVRLYCTLQVACWGAKAHSDAKALELE